ncbi:hypothetical protein BAY13_17125 [Elizabethkingia bruuniana]|uniref:hypothetical protein n=1 Tax=Elizabethkingia bruuniana TaxID=1756149 RepID=UPI00099A2085|nr:hypothetical protein [Elizabethkingia bruuniana]OPC66457.1 hypothetical protein BAY13_17125 [Elizabethkingia bruuniana]
MANKKGEEKIISAAKKINIYDFAKFIFYIPPRLLKYMKVNKFQRKKYFFSGTKWCIFIARKQVITVLQTEIMP